MGPLELDTKTSPKSLQKSVPTTTSTGPQSEKSNRTRLPKASVQVRTLRDLPPLPDRFDRAHQENEFTNHLDAKVAEEVRANSIMSASSRRFMVEALRRYDDLLKTVHVVGESIEKDVLLPQIAALKLIATVALSELPWREKVDFYIKLIPFTGLLQGILGKDLKIAREGESERLDGLERIVFAVSDLIGPITKGASLLAQGKLSLAGVPFFIKPSKLSSAASRAVQLPSEVIAGYERILGESLPAEFRTATQIMPPNGVTTWNSVIGLARINPEYWSLWGIIPNGDSVLISNPSLISKMANALRSRGNNHFPDEMFPHLDFVPVEKAPSPYAASDLFLLRKTPVTDIHDIVLHMAPLWTLGPEVHKLLSFGLQASKNALRTIEAQSANAFVPGQGTTLLHFQQGLNASVEAYSYASMVDLYGSTKLIGNLDVITAAETNAAILGFLVERHGLEAAGREIVQGFISAVPDAIKGVKRTPQTQREVYELALIGLDAEHGAKVVSYLERNKLFESLPRLEFPSFDETRAARDASQRLGFMTNGITMSNFLSR